MKNQVAFFDAIKQKSKNVSIISTIAELLHVSDDGAYRRANGNTSLTYEEYVLLAKHFDVSIDVHQKENKVHFHIPYNKTISKDFDGFVQEMMQVFDSNHMNSKIYYSAKDIPFYYFAMFPDLASFKLFYWDTTIQSSSEQTTNYKFNLDSYSVRHAKKIISFGNFFSQIPSVEIWNEETINSLLGQIIYYYEVGWIEDENTKLRLLNSMIQLLELLELQCATSKKHSIANKKWMANDVPFSLFYNPILYLDNTIIIEKNDEVLQMIPYNAVDYMITDDKKFTNQNLAWFQNQLKNSTSYSNQAKKERLLFFNKMKRKIKESM